MGEGVKFRDNSWLDKSSKYSPLFIESSVEDLKIIYDQQIWYRFSVDGFCVDMFCYFRKNAENLIICGQDAIQRDIVKLPYFYRWSWHAEVASSYITINDPTLYMSDSLNGGWHQGYSSAWALDVVNRILDRIRELLQIPSEKVMLYGISAGGFWALMSAVCFPGCSVVTEIPQVDLFLYEDDGPKEKMLARCYRGRSIKYIKNKYSSRMRVIDRWLESRSLPRRVWIYHNLKDPKNTRTQIEPFWDEVQRLKGDGFLSEIDEIHFMFFNRMTAKGGHIPMEKDQTLAVWKMVLSGM
ncbi:hypothetical protein [Roseomonas sp. USHLN139]|uniref:hypothetical protein n=1 Tax=Roseomonas sp. USHLN139 TaxID=3081298 RepID=UPI003B024CCF